MFLQELDSKPDNIFLITDGLPRKVNRHLAAIRVGPARLKHYRDALRNLPNNVPVNVVLSPMEGDPAAAKILETYSGDRWQLYGTRGGLAHAEATTDT